MKSLILLIYFLGSFAANAQQSEYQKCIELNERAMDIYLLDAVKATALLKKAKEKAISLDNDHLQGLTLANMAIMERLKGEYQLSKNMSLKALKLTKSKNTNASINNNLGACYRALGDYNLSLKYYIKALDYYEKNKLTKKEATVNNNIGLVFSALSQFDKAATYHQKSLELFQKMNDKKGFSETYNNLAIVLANQGNLDKALEYFKKSLEIEEQLKDKKGIAESLSNIGALFSMIQLNDSAVYYLKKAAKTDFEYGNNFGAYETLNSMAQVLVDMNQLDEVKSVIDSTYNYAIQTKSHGLELNALLLYNSYYEKRENFKESNLFLKKYYALKDSLQQNTNFIDLNKLEVSYQTAKKQQLIQKQQAEAKQQNLYLIIVSLLGFFAVLAAFFTYKRQRARNKQQAQESSLKEALLKIENENKLQEQRLDISKELHDNIGSQLTFVISSIDVLKQNFPSTSEKIDRQLENINSFTKNTIEELRDTVWVMNARNMDSSILKERLLENINRAKLSYPEIHFNVNIVDFELQNSLTALNLFRTIQEAINNALKYANATEIKIKISEINQTIEATVSDNGNGFEVQNSSKGNGLKNMRKRIESLGGTFSITSQLNNGTLITLLIPINSK